MIAHQEAERKKNKHKQLTALKTSGQVDIPEHLLPTPLQISSSPTPYPLHICTFNKLFWQTSTNVKFDVYRLVSTYKHNTIIYFHNQTQFHENRSKENIINSTLQSIQKYAHNSFTLYIFLLLIYSFFI